ncbi:protein kinase [Anaerolineales bacterium HSG6]|nr:protein kinase [Anaerolineales bacterium HSG6]
MLNLTGRMLGPYQLAEMIGQGRLATVYQAYQPGPNRRYVALKWFSPQFEKQLGFGTDLHQELKVLTTVNQPHVLSLLDFGQDAGYTYLVMPWQAEPTLAVTLTQQPWTVEQLNLLIAQLAPALSHVHSLGLIHGDIQPRNIFVIQGQSMADSPQYLLADFALANLLTSASQQASMISPEQQAGQSATIQSDIYAWGALIYRLATGQLLDVTSQTVALPSQYNPALSPELEQIILTALAWSPKNRYASMTEMSQAWQQAVSGLSQNQAPTLTPVNIPLQKPLSASSPNPAPALPQQRPLSASFPSSSAATKQKIGGGAGVGSTSPTAKPRNRFIGPMLILGGIALVGCMMLFFTIMGMLRGDYDVLPTATLVAAQNGQVKQSTPTDTPTITPSNTPTKILKQGEVNQKTFSESNKVVTPQKESNLPKLDTPTPTSTLTQTPSPTPSPSATPIEESAPNQPNLPVNNDDLACIGSFGFGVSCLTQQGWQSYNKANSALYGDLISNFAICSDGRVLIMHSSGITSFDGQNWQEYDPDLTAGLDAIACDEQGGIWLAYFGGITYFDGQTWTNYSMENLSNDPSVKLMETVEIAPNGDVWALSSRTAARFDGQTWTIYDHNNGFAEEYFVKGLAIGPNSQPWIVANRELLTYQQGEWQIYHGPTWFIAEDIIVDNQGTVWIGTFNKGLYRFADNNWTNYTPDNSPLSTNRVKSLATDGRGRLWIGTDWGLQVLDGETWHNYFMHTADMVDNEINALVVSGTGPELPALQEKSTGSLTGRVLRAEENTPIASALVELCVQYITRSFDGPTPCAEQPFIHKTQTDADGYFTVSDLPVGHYRVAVQVPNEKWYILTKKEEGYSFGSDERLMVQAGEETRLERLFISDIK